MVSKKEKDGVVVAARRYTTKGAKSKKEHTIMGLLSNWIVEHQIGTTTPY
jgi:hypothetical protein